MLSFVKLRNKDKTILRLTGVKSGEFLEIVKQVQLLWENFQNNKKVSGRSSKLKTLEDEVLMLLIYYRSYVTFVKRKIKVHQKRNEKVHHWLNCGPVRLG